MFTLTYSIKHDYLKFWDVCALCVPRELKDREKWRTDWVYPCSICYDMQMKEKICLTELLPGTNQGCITSNPSQSMLQRRGRIPVHLVHEKGVRLCHQLGRIRVPCFGIRRRYIYTNSRSVTTVFTECMFQHPIVIQCFFHNCAVVNILLVQLLFLVLWAIRLMPAVRCLIVISSQSYVQTIVNFKIIKSS
jgi:hypothetical protein